MLSCDSKRGVLDSLEFCSQNLWSMLSISRWHAQDKSIVSEIPIGEGDKQCCLCLYPGERLVQSNCASMASSLSAFGQLGGTDSISGEGKTQAQRGDGKESPSEKEERENNGKVKVLKKKKSVVVLETLGLPTAMSSGNFGIHEEGCE